MKRFLVSAAMAALASIAMASPINAQAAPCEVHVWDSKTYVSTSPAPYGALLQALHDSKYPTNSVQGQMEYEFRGDALPALISGPWSSQLGQPVTVIVEPGVLDKAQLKALKSNSVRNSKSDARCYYEVYVGKQSFEGGFIKAHLFSEFTMRAFGPGARADRRHCMERD